MRGRIVSRETSPDADLIAQAVAGPPTIWCDAWHPDYPVRWSPTSGLEPDRWLSLSAAIHRLARDYPADIRDQVARELYDDLTAGLVKSTGWATYRLEPRP